jgi:Ser/Thr protein kinase RdoA (MazF antagonist)
LIVEFMGLQGSGKTSLLPISIELLKKQGIQARTVVEAARPVAERTLVGKMVSRLSPQRYRRQLMWQAFRFLCLGSRISFTAKHPALIWQVLNSQAHRPVSARTRERRVLYWFYHLVGCYEFLTAHGQAGEAVVFDDGFVHRAVHLNASATEAPDPASVVAFLDLIPRPDVLIVPRAPLEVCEHRVKRRGLWTYFHHLGEDELSRFLANSEFVVNTVLGYARKKGWAVIEVDNSTDDFALAATELQRKLMDIAPPAVEHSDPIARPAHSGRTSAPRIPYFPRPARLYEYVRSRSRSLDIELETVQSVLGRYGLELTSPASNLPLSRRTRNVILNTTSGWKVLKRYRSRLSLSSIAYGHSILERLAEIGFPAIRFIPTPTGETFVSQEGSNYVLCDFVNGTNYSVSFVLRFHRLILMKMAGKTLAHLHASLNGFVPKGQHHLGFTSYAGGWQRDLLWYVAKVEELKARSRDLAEGQDQSYGQWLVQHSSTILDELTGLDEKLRCSPLTRLIIHGDYGLHNVVFQKNGTVTVLDFESSRLEWRLSDLVSALSRLRFAGGEYDFQSIRSFLDGYQSAYPIAEDEWQFLPSVWRFHKLRASLIYWNSYFETGGPVRKLISASDAVAQADWALRRADKLLELHPLRSA